MSFDSGSGKLIFDIHSAFLVEYSHATTCLQEFYKAVNAFFTRIIIENEEHPDEQQEGLQDNIRSIQEICFFLKTFCSETELHTQLLKNHDAIAIPDVIKEQLDNSDLEFQPPENPNEIYPFELYPEIFTYETVDPAKFVVGHEEEFFVSYIKADTSYLFFLMNASCSSIVIEQPIFCYNAIPEKGTVFGLLLDGVVVRVVRENSLQKRPKSFKVLLIDFGEMMEITQGFKMYQLPEEMQQLPGQAIFCKLSLDDNEDSDRVNFLQDKLHTRQKIRIDRVYKNMLEVTILSSCTPTITTLPNTNSLTPKGSNLDILSKDAMVNNYVTIANNGDVFPLPSTSLNTPSNLKNGNESLTQEELDELYEEPLNTENALEAVMGYTPQDDKRICKFFDPKTNACFKGSNCKLEHTTILKDGWTKDQKIVKLNIRSQVPMPAVGKKINIFIPYVVDVDRFYAQLVHKNCKSATDLTAHQIFEKINAPEKITKFKKFLHPPGECELVFAMFNGEWYRAKILKKFSDIQYRVFYVDYGNCAYINLNEMRQWDDAFDCYPLQALECKLDNITKVNKLDAKAIAYFEHLVLTKSITATITCNVGTLLVTLQDVEKFDIGELLCAAQFAKTKPITTYTNGHGQFPG